MSDRITYLEYMDILVGKTDEQKAARGVHWEKEGITHKSFDFWVSDVVGWDCTVFFKHGVPIALQGRTFVSDEQMLSDLQNNIGVKVKFAVFDDCGNGHFFADLEICD